MKVDIAILTMTMVFSTSLFACGGDENDPQHHRPYPDSDESIPVPSEPVITDEGRVWWPSDFPDPGPPGMPSEPDVGDVEGQAGSGGVVGEAWSGSGGSGGSGGLGGAAGNEQ